MKWLLNKRMRKFNATHIPKPTQKLAFYPQGPLDLEIGCGVGLHAMEYCKKYPNRTLVALDRSRMRIQKMKNTIQKQGGLENLIVVCEDADKFVHHQIKDQSIEHLFLLYPNPYPKARQANKRWHRMPIMQLFLEKLMDGGCIHVATNESFYAQEAKAYLMDQWNLELVNQNIYKDKLPFQPRTHFEKKYIERGDDIWDLQFRKKC